MQYTIPQVSIFSRGLQNNIIKRPAVKTRRVYDPTMPKLFQGLLKIRFWFYSPAQVGVFAWENNGRISKFECDVFVSLDLIAEGKKWTDNSPVSYLRVQTSVCR